MALPFIICKKKQQQSPVVLTAVDDFSNIAYKLINYLHT
jgi:hypothetical protein